MRRLLTAVVTVSALSACDDPFSPEGVAGFYFLETLNGAPVLPIFVEVENEPAFSRLTGND